jgi:hypothetical protein
VRSPLDRLEQPRAVYSAQVSAAQAAGAM